MEEDKSSVADCPPAYVVSGLTNEHARNPKKSKALFGYAVAVTTALIVVLVLGGVYYYKSIETLQATILKFDLSRNQDAFRSIDDIELDELKNVVLYHLGSPDFEPGSFSVLDYTKSMLGVYDSGPRSCYLIGGIKQNFLTFKCCVVTFR
jgi:hypothetical protein